MTRMPSPQPQPDLTDDEALAEARRRWGPSGAVRYTAPSRGKERGRTGRLARYAYRVGNGHLGRDCSFEGQGDSWLNAFADARAL